MTGLAPAKQKAKQQLRHPRRSAQEPQQIKQLPPQQRLNSRQSLRKRI
jgi:hypothetical protein